MSISENDALYGLLGNNFGGDEQQGSFGLPDLSAVAPTDCQYCISLLGEYRNARYEGLLGETMISPTTINPPNLVECAGQSLSISQNRLLHTFIDARFGKDDGDHFKLPDLRKQAPAKCLYLMATSGDTSGRQDAYIGQIILLPYDDAPQGWRVCNGDLLSITQNTALFSLLGTRFGGDGSRTFGIPDLRKNAPSNFNYFINWQRGIFPPRS